MKLWLPGQDKNINYVNSYRKFTENIIVIIKNTNNLNTKKITSFNLVFVQNGPHSSLRKLLSALILR